MRLKLARQILTEVSTIGSFYADGNFLCFTLEDKDRDLNDTMEVIDIAKKKLFGQTAIPYGTYEVIMSYSDKFKMYLPQLLNVKDYEGVRIHPGNTDADTEGCILVGELKSENFIGNSRKAFYDIVLPLIQKAIQEEKLFIDIVKEVSNG